MKSERWLTVHGDLVEVYPAVKAWSDDGWDAEWCWRYRIRARNGRIVEQGSEGYTRRRGAIEAALRHHPRVEKS